MRDRRSGVSHPGELIVGQVHPVGEDHALVNPHPVDLALALREVDGREEPALAGDLVDGLEEIGGAGIGGMGPQDHTDAASLSFIEVREKFLERGKACLAFKASLRRARDRGLADRARGREQVGGRIESQAPASSEIEDRRLPGTELIHEGGRAAAREFKETECDKRLELVRVEVGDGERPHRHEHRIDLALADRLAREIVDNAAEQGCVDGVVVEVDETRKSNPPGDHDRLAFRQLSRQIGDAAVLGDDGHALDRHLPTVPVHDRPIGTNDETLYRHAAAPVPSRRVRRAIPGVQTAALAGARKEPLAPNSDLGSTARHQGDDW